MNHEGAVSGKLLIYWLVTIILPCLVLLLPVNEIMTADLKVFLSITLAAILFLQHMEESGEVSGRVKWIWLSVAAAYFVLMYPAASGLPMPRLYAQFLEYVLPCGMFFFGAF